MKKLTARQREVLLGAQGIQVTGSIAVLRNLRTLGLVEQPRQTDPVNYEQGAARLTDAGSRVLQELRR